MISGNSIIYQVTAGVAQPGRVYRLTYWARLATGSAGGCMVVATACGAVHGEGDPDGGTGNGPGHNAGGGAGNGGGQVGDAFSGFADALTRPDPGGFNRGDMACAAQTLKAERLPLDLLVMMDSSGSMLDEVEAGRSKWRAVADAMAAFFRDTASAGIGVGLHYFPQLEPNVPAECSMRSAIAARLRPTAPQRSKSPTCRVPRLRSSARSISACWMASRRRRRHSAV